ncbi:MAG: DUF2911 domain-containing protein [Chryseolinea sp.]
MKKIITAVLIVLVHATYAQLSGPPSGDNQKSSVTQWIGLVSVTIHYSSPDVHTPSGEDRKGHIWGELVPYGFINQGYGPSKAAPWRAGANENTTITFSHDVQIDGKPLKAGSYGLFLEVEKDGPWQWIFSKNSMAWGSYYYSEAEDALRAKSNPSDNAYSEWLTYGFDDRQPTSTFAYLAWENKKAGFKIEVPNVNELYVDKITQELDGTTLGFSAENYTTAAMFCAQNKVKLEQGLKWADFALASKKDYSTLSAKGMVLTAMGKDQEAADVMAMAIKEPTASIQNIHQYGRFLLNAGEKEKAMEIFQFNRKKHPEDKFTTYVGLARGYTAMGDKKSAIKNWETAIKNLPEDQKQNMSLYQAEIDKLKS